MAITNFSVRRGQNLNLIFNLEQGDPTTIASVSAKARKISVVNVIQTVDFTVNTRTPVAPVIAAWDLVLNTSSLETGQYQANVKVTLNSGEIIKSDIVTIEIKDSVA